MSWLQYLEPKPEGQNRAHRSLAEKSAEPSEPSHRAPALQMGPAMTLVVMAYPAFCLSYSPADRNMCETGGEGTLHIVSPGIQ